MTGSAAYLDNHPEIQEPLPRIYIEFEPEGIGRSFFALADTGGHYCIFEPDLARRVRDRLSEHIAKTRIRSARGLLEGDLYSYNIRLLANQGESLDVEVVVFIAPEWRGPNLIGYVGALERIRFAFDPSENMFYFGNAH